MKKILLHFLFLLISLSLHGQNNRLGTPEFQVSYFGEFLAHPGMKVGIHFPLNTAMGVEENLTIKKAKYTTTKTYEIRVGTNLAFYNQRNHHAGYLANVELSCLRKKEKSNKPGKVRYFDAAIALGYYRYILHGTTFAPEGEGFSEIRGNGHALMPSFSFGWGRDLRFIKAIDLRYFTKGSCYFERPYATGVMPHIVLEMGFATTFSTTKKETDDQE